MQTLRQTCWLLASLWFAIAQGGAPAAASCRDEEFATFDGSFPLRYATVEKVQGARLYIHSRFPDSCDAAKQDECTSSSYLIPGDEVAVAVECDGWAHIQYLGQTRVTTGWISTLGIKIRRPAVEESVYAPNLTSSTPTRYLFELTKGSGVPVCEAYLQRLNQTTFESPPYCGRPESTVVPGFAFLQRRYLSVEEYNRLFVEVTALTSNETEQQVEQSGLERESPDFRPSAWTYRSPLDMRNDARPSPVVIWNGWPRDESMCGLQGAPWGRGGDLAIVLSGDRKHVEHEQTMQLFGIPARYRQDHVRMVTEFGKEFGIFEYRGKFYYDTFLEDVPEGFEEARKRDPNLLNTLGVFEFRDGEKREICEYYVQSLEEDQ